MEKTCQGCYSLVRLIQHLAPQMLVTGLICLFVIEAKYH